MYFCTYWNGQWSVIWMKWCVHSSLIQNAQFLTKQIHFTWNGQVDEVMCSLESDSKCSVFNQTNSHHLERPGGWSDVYTREQWTADLPLSHRVPDIQRLRYVFVFVRNMLHAISAYVFATVFVIALISVKTLLFHVPSRLYVCNMHLSLLANCI